MVGQVELCYPPAKDRPPLQTQHTDNATQSDFSLGSKSKRPRFCDVLARSLKPQAELRAWFNEQLGYQAVQQTRIPLNMPNVRQHNSLHHLTRCMTSLHMSFLVMSSSHCHCHQSLVLVMKIIIIVVVPKVPIKSNVITIINVTGCTT